MEAKELIEFIEKSPTAFQAISTISEMLKKIILEYNIF